MLITPIRIVLGLVVLAVASLGDARGASVGLAFAVGAAFLAFAALTDRRALLLHTQAEPVELPADAVEDPAWRVAVDAAFPSTVGVTVLGLVAFGFGNEVLAAALGGACAGMGIASVLSLGPLLAWERERGARLYSGRRGRARYIARESRQTEPAPPTNNR